MKLKLITAFIALAIMVVPSAAFASTNEPLAAVGEPIKPVKPIHVYIEGKEVVSDTEPVLLNERTMLPIRAVAEALGARVSWATDGTVGIQRDGLSIHLGLGLTTATVGGKTVKLDAPIILYNGRTLVPVRFIAENLNCDLQWDNATSSVLIRKAATPVATNPAPTPNAQIAKEPVAVPGPDLPTSTQPSPVAVAIPRNQNLGVGSTSAVSSDNAVEEIYKHVANHESSFTLQLPSLYYGQEQQLLEQAFQKDDYLNYIVAAAGSGSLKQGDSATIKFTIQYRETPEQTQFVKDQVSKILADIIKPGMNDFEKEKAIHDYVVTHLSYDESFQEASYTAYGAMTNGKAVCQGYALLMYRMLTDAGLPARIYEGYGDNGFYSQKHAWNGVQLEGNWFNVDATWDDPIGSAPDEISYRYFNLTDEELQKDHKWTKSYPKANTNFIQTLDAKLTADPPHNTFYQSLLDQIRPVREYAGDAVSAEEVYQLVKAAVDQNKPSVTVLFHGNMKEASKVYQAIFPKFSYKGYPRNLQYMPNGKDTVLLFTLVYQ